MLQAGAGTAGKFKPFSYPPDFALARLHQLASMPGTPDPEGQVCPCCGQRTKVPFEGWWGRSVEEDFGQYGGAVVGYFWLIKLYLATILAITVVYAAYLQYLNWHYCEVEPSSTLKDEDCSRILGYWLVANEDLYTLIDRTPGAEGVLVRFLTLRQVALLVLLASNVLSLYIIRWFKVRYPDPRASSDFALLFKNLGQQQLGELLERLEREVGPVEYKEAFVIKKVEPFYSAYQEKVRAYYECRIEDDPKKHGKKLRRLERLQQQCRRAESSFYQEGNRAIVVFSSCAYRNRVLQHYRVDGGTKLRMFVSNAFEEGHGMWAEACPRAEEIIWSNIGLVERQGLRSKVASVVYFLAIVGFLCGFIYFFIRTIYLSDMAEPYKSIVVNVVLLVVVVIALIYRQLMNRVSEMRFPATFTARSMFIIITTTLYHLVNYLFVPSMFLWLNPHKRGGILQLTCTQAFNFILVQVLLAGYDLMWCCWNKGRRQVEDEERPLGCQKILHERMQYPRFPIEFKLIILFKIWSFILFFAFHVPLILFLIGAVLGFLYVKDKQNVYYHYRMEVQHNDLQFDFLRVYVNLFAAYLLLVFLWTQSSPYEYAFSIAAVALSVACQLLFLRSQSRPLPTAQPLLDSIDAIPNPVLYQQLYQDFLDRARCDSLDIEINEYLSKSSTHETTKTETSMLSKLTEGERLRAAQ